METLKGVPSWLPPMVWTQVVAELNSDPETGTGHIVDVGGGTGGFAVPLAQAGHRVTVVDPSPNALAGLTRRAADAGVKDRIQAIQGDTDALDSLVEPGTVQLVLCHSVLEMVDSPRASLEAIARALAPGSAASILVANRAGAVLSRALSGNLTAATALLSDPDGRVGPRDTLSRRFDPRQLARLTEDAGLVAEKRHGVQVLADLIPGGRDAETGSTEALRQFEQAAADTPPYRDIATHIHLLARKVAKTP